MILYTVVPPETIFSSEDDEKTNGEMVVAIHNFQLVVRPKEDKWEVVRLLSTDPNDYLNDQYQPGQLLSLKPSIQ